MAESRLVSYYRFAIHHWSSILSGLSVTGFLVAYELNLPQHYRDFFMFLGANAIIWTLVEIRLSLRSRSHPARFPNMRSARPFIMAGIKKVLAFRRDNHVRIVGGRIRTISDMLRELVVAIQRGEIQGRNTKITVYCLDSAFVSSEMQRVALRDSAAFTARLGGYGDLINQFSLELQSYNNLPELMKYHISFDVVLYRSLPSFYGFLLDRTALFWGFFTWNVETEDFDGPPNPCFEYTEHSEQFADFYGWLENRVQVFDLTGAHVLPRPNRQSENDRS